MAQDLPPASGRGYPLGGDGQEAAGYDQQQPWYDPSQTQPQPYGDGQQQPWQWQDGLPQQREPEAYYPSYPEQAAPGGYGYGEPGAGYPQQPGYDGGAGAYQSGDYQPTAGYPAAAGYQAPSGYDPAPSYETAPSYDPASPYESAPSYQGTADHQTPPSPDGAPTSDGFPTSGGAPATAEFPALAGDGPDADPAGERAEPEPGDGDPAAPRKARTARTSPAAGVRAALTARARAARTAVLSAEHTPEKRALLIRSGAGLAALAVLVTAGVVATGSSGGAPTGPVAGSTDTGFAVAHDKLWSAQPAAAAPPGTDDTLLGSWLLADAVVRADSSGVHAYGLADGKPTWSVEPPAAGAVPCGLSPSVNSAGLGAALFRAAADPKSPCTLVAAVDTKTGKTAWTKSLSDTKNPYSAHVAVTADLVVAVGDDKAAAWATADGKDAWQYAGQGKFCSLSGNAAGATVLLHSTCADSTPADQAVSLTAADGKVLWWRGLNNQPKTVTVLSAEPAVVLTTGDKPTDDRVFAWGAAGDPVAEIPVMLGDARLDVSRGGFDPVPGVFFQDHTMVTTLTPTSTAGTVAAAAYDLGTGKQLWHTPVSEKGTVRAVGLDNGALVLAADSRVGQPAHLSRLALTNGQEAVGGGFPRDTGSLLTSGRVVIGAGKVVTVPEHSSNFGIAAAYQAKG